MPTCSDEGYDRGVRVVMMIMIMEAALIPPAPSQDLKIISCKNHHILDALDLEPVIVAKRL